MMMCKAECSSGVWIEISEERGVARIQHGESEGVERS